MFHLLLLCFLFARTVAEEGEWGQGGEEGEEGECILHGWEEELERELEKTAKYICWLAVFASGYLSETDPKEGTPLEQIIERVLQYEAQIHAGIADTTKVQAFRLPEGDFSQIIKAFSNKAVGCSRKAEQEKLYLYLCLFGKLSDYDDEGQYLPS